MSTTHARVQVQGGLNGCLLQRCVLAISSLCCCLKFVIQFMHSGVKQASYRYMYQMLCFRAREGLLYCGRDSERAATAAACAVVYGCNAIRNYAKGRVSDRDDDLIHEGLADRFGDEYMCVQLPFQQKLMQCTHQGTDSRRSPFGSSHAVCKLTCCWRVSVMGGRTAPKRRDWCADTNVPKGGTRSETLGVRAPRTPATVFSEIAKACLVLLLCTALRAYTAPVGQPHRIAGKTSFAQPQMPSPH
jgi:hypothetical protein